MPGDPATHSSAGRFTGGGSRAKLVAQLLVECVRHPDRPPPEDLLERALAGGKTDPLLTAIDHHKVAGCVRNAVQGMPAAAPVWPALEARYRRALGQHMRAEMTLKQAAGALNAAGLRWLVLKGPVLEQRVYSIRRLRTYGDIDLLVAAGDLAAATGALESAGMRSIDYNWTLIHELMASEVHLMPEFGTEVDLHWHIVFDSHLRRRFPVRVTEMVERAVPVEVAGVSALTFEPADTLLHLAAHAGVEGGDRLLWLKDLEQVILGTEPDWDAVVERARAWNLRLQTGTMLARTSATLGTPVPPAVLRDLLPAGWRAVLRAVDRVSPPARSTGLGTPGTFLARSTRHSVTTSVASLGRRATERGWRIAARRLDPDRHEHLSVAIPESQTPGRMDAARPSSDMYFPSGGEAERQAFLADVAREA